MCDLVQILNPRTGAYTVVDRDRGTILRHGAVFQHGIPVADVVREQLAASMAPLLSCLMWEDARTSRERELDAPQRWRATSGFVVASRIMGAGEDPSEDTPGTVVMLDGGEEIRLAVSFEAFRDAFAAAMGAPIVEVS